MAYNTSGNNDFAGVNATTITTPPTGLTAVNSNTGSVTLNWTPPSIGAATYNIYRSMTSGGEGATTPIKTGVTGTVQSNGTVSYSDSSGVNNTTYYYEVSAVNANTNITPTISSESLVSNEANVLFVTPPANTPSTPTAVPGNQAISVIWPTVANATSYSIYRSTAAGQETLYQSNLPATGGQSGVFTDFSVTAGTTYFYKVCASNGGGPSALSPEASSVAVGASTLSDSDIGESQAGSINVKNGTYTITAGGLDIFGTADQFNYDAGTVLPTNSVIETEVTNIQNITAYTKAGVMYRANNSDHNYMDPGAAEVSMLATPGAGVLFEYRLGYQAFTTSVKDMTVPAPSASAPVWLEVVRTGNNYSGFYSLNGLTWVQVGTATTVNLGNTPVAGIGVTSHNNTLTATASFTNVLIPSVVSLPAVPTGVTAIPGSSSVSVVFPNVPKATSYNIYRSTTSGGEAIYKSGILASGGTSTLFTDTNVTNGTTYYYKVTALNAAGETAPSTESSATPVAAGALRDADIGGLAPSAGSAVGSGTITLSGGGADIFGNSDQFNFDSSAGATGNTALTTEITSLSNTNPFTKAGLMLRSDGSPGSAQVSVLATPGNGVMFEWCAVAGNASVSVKDSTVPIPTASNPVWLQLIRIGNSFSAFYSLNGSAWVQVGTAQTVSLSPTPLAGLAITSHNTGKLATATFTNTSIPGSTAAPAIPTGITAVAAGTAVSLLFPSVSGATSYNIYRSTSAGGETLYKSGVTPGGGASTLFTDTAVTAGTKYYYKVTALAGGAESGQSSEVVATPTALGTLADADIGIGSDPAGNASLSNGTYTVSGSGGDIFNKADAFNFDSTTTTGDTTLITKVTSLSSPSNTSSVAKAGVMFRASSDPKAAEVSLVATPGEGVFFQWRSTYGGVSNSVKVLGISGPTAAKPVWVQLVRTGSTFTAFYSADGVSWIQIGTPQTIALSSLPSAALTGLAVTSHNDSQLATATFTNVVM